MCKITVDARGRSCPEPVIMTKSAMDQHKESVVEVIVDSKVALENVSRLGKNNGYVTEITEAQDEFYILLRK